MLIVSHISSHYNNSVADEVGPLFFLEGGETMSDFEILSIVIDILTILISFGSLIALICFRVIGQKVCVTNPNKLENL